jgi:hypothetical protein
MIFHKCLVHYHSYPTYFTIYLWRSSYKEYLCQLLQNELLCYSELHWVRMCTQAEGGYFKQFLWTEGAGIAQWYSSGLQAGWLGVQVLTESGNFSLCLHIQTGSGAHPVSYPVDTRGSFPGGTVARLWSWSLALSTPPLHLHGVVLS